MKYLSYDNLPLPLSMACYFDTVTVKQVVFNLFVIYIYISFFILFSQVWVAFPDIVSTLFFLVFVFVLKYSVFVEVFVDSGLYWIGKTLRTPLSFPCN